ncbi:MAG: def1 [Bacillales bacterium]|nr:def1 [Bacillales bacterium]
MAILKIIEHPNEILSTECEEVFVFDNKLRKLIKNMYETMIEHDGVGLAAPQIGINKRIAIVDIDDGTGLIELINPVIIHETGRITDIEGCLSIPGVFGDVTRAHEIKIRAQNAKGKQFTITANGFLARAIAHEIDHLNGTLFISKVEKYYELETLEG